MPKMGLTDEQKNVSAIWRVKTSTRLSRPVFESYLPAGFPSPAQDYAEERIDLNRDLIINPLHTYYARLIGDSMIERGMFDGSLIAFDRRLEAVDGDVVVACVDNTDLCCKVYRDGHQDGQILLEPANSSHSPIPITGEMELRIIGLVTFSFQWHARHYRRHLVFRDVH